MYYLSNDPGKYKISSRIKRRFFRSSKFHSFKILILCIISLILFYKKDILRSSHIIQKLNNFKFQFYSVSNKVANKFHNIRINFKDFETLKKQYKLLEELKDKQQIQTNDRDLVYSENLRLKKLINYTSSVKSTIIKSTKIILSPQLQESTGYINLGKK